MQKKYLFAAMLCAAALTTACSSDDDNLTEEPGNDVEVPMNGTAEFAKNDGSEALRGTAQQMVQTLLKKVGPKVAEGIGLINIKEDEKAEIKQFTDDLVKDCKTEAEIYQKILDYVKTIEYKHEYEGGNIISNDPYPVFKKHVAICQGFANLQHIMLESQGIPTLNVNGQLVQVGGHAWNYVYHSGKWWVSDPTNAGYLENYPGTFDMDKIDSYRHLEPSSIEGNIMENDQVVVNYTGYELNIDKIKSTDKQFVVPFGINGLRITSLSPTQPVPSQIKEIYISKNVRTLGEYYMGLVKNAPSVEACYVDKQNARLEGEYGVIYKRNGSNPQLSYVPAMLRKLVLRRMDTVDKNVVFDHKALEEVTIANGTKEINDFAFEKCPNLKVAYIPAGVKVSKKAFSDVHPDFKIIKK